MPAIHLYLDKESRDLVKKVPRDVSLSNIFKWILLSIVLPEKELLKKINKDRKEVDEIVEFLKDKLGRLAGD